MVEVEDFVKKFSQIAPLFYDALFVSYSKQMCLQLQKNFREIHSDLEEKGKTNEVAQKKHRDGLKVHYGHPSNSLYFKNLALEETKRRENFTNIIGQVNREFKVRILIFD
jgi:hypothetical protein